jgi:hypothetical protein
MSAATRDDRIRGELEGAAPGACRRANANEADARVSIYWSGLKEAEA